MAAECQKLSFFFNDTATTEIYTLSLHDALPISVPDSGVRGRGVRCLSGVRPADGGAGRDRNRLGRKLEILHLDGHGRRSEEHTSELQSRQYLVCRLLLEKKNQLHLPTTRLYPQT